MIQDMLFLPGELNGLVGYFGPTSSRIRPRLLDLALDKVDVQLGLRGEEIELVPLSVSFAFRLCRLWRFEHLVLRDTPQIPFLTRIPLPRDVPDPIGLANMLAGSSPLSDGAGLGDVRREPLGAKVIGHGLGHPASSIPPTSWTPVGGRGGR